MRIGLAAVRPQSGAISTVLIGLAGFATGALLMGLVALTRQPVPIAAESSRLPASNSAPNDVVPTPTMPYGNRAWATPAEPHPWPFESATPGPGHAPGAQRPDRLSGPDGWTPEVAPGP
jgi:hypothetical protein